MKKSETTGFTLIEVMFVVAIIATLAALLFPVLINAKGSAKRSACVAREKEIGLAMLMYAKDYDDTFPAVRNGTELLADGVYHEISWIDVIQPYAERISDLNDRGKSKSHLDAPTGSTMLLVCPSQIADPRASVNYLGVPRLSSGGVGVTYALPPYAYQARSQSEFANIGGTVLAAEQYMNFTATYYFPVDWDGDQGASNYGVAESDTNDCRFDRGTECTFAAGTYPAHPEAMPGMYGPWISNLGSWHGNGLNILFTDGHVAYTIRQKTYRVDGSFSAWTVSNRWCWPSNDCHP